MKLTALALTQLPASCAYPSQGFFHSTDWFRCLHESAVRSQPYILALDDTAFLCRRDGRTLHSFTNYYTMELALPWTQASVLEQCLRCRSIPLIYVFLIRNGAWTSRHV